MDSRQFDFGEAIAFIKCGLKVVNSRGNILFQENGKIFCIPKNHYPKGRREEIRLYWDSALAEDWELFNE